MTYLASNPCEQARELKLLLKTLQKAQTACPGHEHKQALALLSYSF